MARGRDRSVTSTIRFSLRSSKILERDNAVAGIIFSSITER
jgi:hypothetical protein